MKKLLKWDVYEVSSEEEPLVKVKFKGSKEIWLREW